jgi:Uma2 family endonuclease
VRVRATGLTAYPDVSVVCGKLETDAEDPNAIVNPILLVEVLSDSTEALDRGEKAAHYRHIPALKEYVFLSQRSRRIEVHRRNEANRWELFEFEEGARADLASVACAIAVDDVYRDPLAAVVAESS